jgi:DNA-binding HxlR family transcriptional regulator
MKSYAQDCPVANTLDIIGDRWTLLIVRDLFLGRTRFAEFQQSLRGIPTNLLGDRLKQLEDHGIVERRFYSEHPPRAEYVLTEKGRGFDVVLGALGQWGNQYAPASTQRLHAACNSPVRLRWYCPTCDVTVPRREVVMGPAAPLSAAS